MTYGIGLERGDQNFADLEPLYRQHYGEMQDRLRADGMDVSDFDMRLDQYNAAWRGGWLLNFVVRHNGEAVGYSNVYLTNDMHNRDLIAQEDAVYVMPEHRNGIGRKLVLFVLDHLRERGVKRAYIEAVTDLRAEKLWRRIGFKEVATKMMYSF